MNDSRMMSLSLALLLIGALPAAAQTKIVLHHSASTDYLPAVVANAKGFFAKRGLSVNLTVSAQPGGLPAAVVGGSIQMGSCTGTQLALARAAGLDLTLVAGASIQTKANPTISVVVSTASNIKSVSDFKGRKVVTPGFNGVLHVMFQKWLLDRGVDPKSVTFLDQGFAQMGDLLKSGLADAALPVEPFRSRIIQLGMGRSFANYFADTQDNTLVSFYITTGKWAEDNSKAVTDFREALREGVAFIRANRPEANTLAASHLKLPAQVVESLPTPDYRVDVPAQSLQFWIDVTRQFNLIDKPLTAASMMAP